ERDLAFRTRCAAKVMHLPVARDLQDRRAGRSAMRHQDFFAKRRSALRTARRAVARTQHGLALERYARYRRERCQCFRWKRERYEPGPGRNNAQAELLRQAIAERGRTQLRHGKSA